MNENSNVVALRQPDEIDDPLTDILRSGAGERIRFTLAILSRGLIGVLGQVCTRGFFR